MKRPLLLPLAAAMSGIITATVVEVAFSFALATLLLVLIALLVTFRRHSTIALIIIGVVFFLTCFLHMRLIMDPPRDKGHVSWYINHGVTPFEGVIVDLPTTTSASHTSLTISVYRIYEHGQARSIHGKVLLSVKTPRQDFYPGDVVRFKTQLRAIAGFHNPGVFDYERYMHDRGIWVRGYISQPGAICVLRSGYDYPVLSSITRYRMYLKGLIATSAPYPESTILQASLLGTQQAIPDELREKFNRTGTSHIIAISGFNVGIVAGFAALLCRWTLSLYPPLLLWINLQLISSLAAGLLVVFYTFIAGAGISVLRATIMILVFIFALILGRIRLLENTLFLAATILLLFSPYLLFDLSFQLSFCAVYALIRLTPPLMELMPFGERLPPIIEKPIRSVYAFVIATICATIGTLPIIVFHFHRLSPLVLFSNLLVVPILGVLVIPLITLVIVTAPVSVTITRGIIAIASFLVQLSIRIIDYLSSLPYASILLPHIGLGQVALYLTALVTFVLWLDQERRKFIYLGISAVLSLTLVFTVLIPHGPQGKGTFQLTALDVGQGQSLFLRLPSGEAMLIDGGGFYDQSFDLGRNVLTPFLLHKGVTELTRIIITHPHPDHVGGLLYLARNFSVREVWLNRDASAHENTEELRFELQRRRIPMRIVSSEMPSETRDGIALQILHPPPPGREMNFRNENDRSLVIKITHGTVHFLLPADISEEVERQILAYGRNIVRSDVLIVPHHGSRHSSSITFIKAVRPAYACISAGGTGKYPLPHPAVIGRYRSVGIDPLRTDRHGAITFISNGHHVYPQTFR